MSRLTLGMSTPNILAAVLAVVIAMLPALLLVARDRGWRWKMWVGGTVVSVMLAVLLAWTSSRGGLLAALVGLLAAALALRGRERLLPMALVMVLLITTALSSLGQRWAATSVQQPSVATRLHLWRITAVLAADHPWAGIGSDTNTFALACVSSALPPAHLRVNQGSPFGWALNDVLDQACKRGALAAIAALTLALLPIVLGGISCWRGARTRGSRRAAIALFAGGTAWYAAGMVSCVWFFDAVASTIAWSLLAGVAAAMLIGTSWLTLQVATGWAVVGATASYTVVLLIAPIIAGVQPRLLASDGPVRWRLEPRTAAIGGVVYLRGPEEDEEETLRHALRPIAESGFAVTAVDNLAAMPLLPAPRIIVARGPRCALALSALAAGQTDALVLFDPLASAADDAPVDGRVIALHGHQANAADRLAWATRLGGQAAELPLHRLWARRIEAAWPAAVARLPAPFARTVPRTP